MNKSISHDIFINSYPISTNNKISGVDIKLESQNPIIFTKPPFPPMMNVDKIISKKNNKNKNSTKTHNAFIIYRNAYIDHIHLHGIRLNMIDISPIVSMLWNQEPFYIKEVYKKLEKENDNNLSKLAYHEIMSNWHKELSSYEINPYQYYEDSMKVPYFNTHLV
ncbi:3293_t:CDS:2 [Cetraspora pellucida]|uniref:3293_t:CDS:1 n=1 Tax=Cetraspora pellucida TaxID=1433469 RepID=A0A9N9NIE6_9GLOM|nr:3293_t:CDS:2 [Cetraspora pellucida]